MLPVHNVFNIFILLFYLFIYIYILQVLCCLHYCFLKQSDTLQIVFMKNVLAVGHILSHLILTTFLMFNQVFNAFKL